MAEGNVCRNCFHSYVCEKFNENKDDDNKKCHFFNDHFVPTADVVEAKHGEWISHEGYEECGECHTKAIYPHNYCPNCGARMDGTPKERGE